MSNTQLKVLVCIKRVVDYNVRVRVKPDGSGVAVEGLKMSINPFDEIALEEALRLKERGQASDVAVATCSGICYRIDYGPGWVRCFCRLVFWQGGHCNCDEFSSNGDKQCIAYGACSYSI